MKDFTGVFTALVTPFKGGEIDWGSLRRLLRHQLEGSISGLVISGTTGESPTLDAAEKEKLFKFIKSEVANQVPLVLGTGTNSTSDTVDATRAAEAWGADGALVVVPYYNKPPQRGLFAHFQKVAESSGLPVILYNVPGRTITRLEVDTIVELSRLPGIVGIKEASGDIEFGRRVIEECRTDFLVSSGDDGTFLDLIGVGGRGVISVASNIMPKEFSSWYARARQGDRAPQAEFQRIAELNSFLYVEANPIPIKMALHFMGVIESAELRLPLMQLSEPHAAELKRKMLTAGLI